MEADNTVVTETIVAPMDAEAVEERRERRKFKYMALRVVTLTAAGILSAAVVTVLATAYKHDKELNTDFITEVAKVIFDFAKYLYQG